MYLEVTGRGEPGVPKLGRSPSSEVLVLGSYKVSGLRLDSEISLCCKSFELELESDKEVTISESSTTGPTHRSWASDGGRICGGSAMLGFCC